MCGVRIVWLRRRRWEECSAGAGACTGCMQVRTAPITCTCDSSPMSDTDFHRPVPSTAPHSGQLLPTSVQSELVARGTTDPKLVQAILDMFCTKEVLPTGLEVVEAQLRPSAFSLGGASGEFAFTVGEHMCGKLSRALVGGWLPLLTDTLTACVMLGHRVRVAEEAGQTVPGEVSVELNCSITRAAMLGSRVVVKVNVTHAGARASFAEARFLDDRGRVLAVGRHVAMVVRSSMM